MRARELVIVVERPTLAALRRARNRALDLAIAVDDARADLARQARETLLDDRADAIREARDQLRELQRLSMAAQIGLAILVERVARPGGRAA